MAIFCKIKTHEAVCYADDPQCKYVKAKNWYHERVHQMKWKSRTRTNTDLTNTCSILIWRNLLSYLYERYQILWTKMAYFYNLRYVSIQVIMFNLHQPWISVFRYFALSQYHPYSGVGKNKNNTNLNSIRRIKVLKKLCIIFSFIILKAWAISFL